MRGSETDEQLKGAEALTFAAALIGLCGYSLRAVWFLDAGDPVALLILVTQALPFIFLLVLAASRCIRIGIRSFMPSLSDGFIPYFYAVGLTIFVALAPWEAGEKMTVEEERDAGYCRTLRCLISPD